MTVDPEDLSSIYFDTSDQPMSSFLDYYVSPAVQVQHVRQSCERGLFATKPISKGTCIFVTPPTLSANVVDVMSKFGHKNDDTLATSKSLEELAEENLVEQMMSSSSGIRNSFLGLQGSGNEGAISAVPTVERLAGKEDSEIASIVPSRAQCLQIIRQNAFGPDGLETYENISQSCGMGNESRHPWRLLGLYPLAAMINHSCVPNCVRVFCQEIMIAHTTRAIEVGEELVWSYIPPILPFPDRKERLQHYLFDCRCARCQIEEQELWNPNEQSLKSLQSLNIIKQGSLDVRPTKLHVQMVEKLLSRSNLSSQTQRYIRTGLTTLFIRYFNIALSTAGAEIDATLRDSILKLCTQLHLSLLDCHNAGTEHLSILHFAYDLTKSAYWVEQLKQAHLIRYGSLGNNIENVRRVMQHTRMVSRTQSGMRNAVHHFL